MCKYKDLLPFLLLLELPFLFTIFYSFSQDEIFYKNYVLALCISFYPEEDSCKSRNIEKYA